jgi:hypothetical protein
MLITSNRSTRRFLLSPSLQSPLVLESVVRQKLGQLSTLSTNGR